MSEFTMVAPGYRFEDDAAVMRHALNIAQQGIGLVEPNPAVGAVIVDDNLTFIADGFHQRFGDPHAEIMAISVCGNQTTGRQIFVTLEPCSHHGKTPPCADAVIAAGFSKVVIGCTDPAPHVAGKGIAKLQQAGIEVVCGVCESEAQDLIAPFRKLQLEHRPWVHAKWAMTLDGRIATRIGHSKWISNEQSRAAVHQLRGRMDAIITGSGTVRADNPTLTARPPGHRTPLRIVVDSDGQCVKPNGNLIQSMELAPVLVCVRKDVMDAQHCTNLETMGIEVLATAGDANNQIQHLLQDLGNRQFTNVLLEAGSGLLGAFFDAQLVDEVHAFVAPKIVGGHNALSPIGGTGVSNVPKLDSLKNVQSRNFGTNVLIEGRFS